MNTKQVRVKQELINNLLSFYNNQLKIQGFDIKIKESQAIEVAIRNVLGQKIVIKTKKNKIIIENE